MVLLEREPALASLDALLAGAATGHGVVVALSGEAGIGKTSLAREFAANHEADARVLWGACDALSAPRPLGPLYDIARAARGDLAAVMVSDASRFERFTAFLDALKSSLRPVIAVIDDIHWADEATRDLILFVARRIADTNAVLVLSYRDDEVDAEHPLQVVLGRLAPLDAVERIALRPLSVDAVAVLAERDDDAAELHRVTGGNPFFVTQVLATDSAEPVPSTVRDAVLARAARLSAPARRALEVAALVPDRAETAMVQEVSGTNAAALEECEASGLIIIDRWNTRFRHELARRAIEGSVSALSAPGLHAGILGFLEQQTPADLARLSHHAERVGDAESILRHAPAAAKQASRLGAHHEAVMHYERALPHAELIPPDERADLFERYARKCSRVDRETTAVEWFERALSAWREAGAVDAAARVKARLALELWSLGQGVRARVMAQEALDEIAGRPRSRASAMALIAVAQLSFFDRDIERAIAVGTRALTETDQLGDVWLRTRALYSAGAAELFHEPDRGRELLARGISTARELNDDYMVAAMMDAQGLAYCELRKYTAAAQWIQQCIDWCLARDVGVFIEPNRAWLARVQFEQGRWSDAAATAASVPDDHGKVRQVVAKRLVEGRLAVVRGDASAGELLEECAELSTAIGELHPTWPAAAARAELAWWDGDAARIGEIVGETFARACERKHPWAIGELGFWLWRAGALISVPDGAAAPFALQIAGDWKGAAAQWRAIGCPYEEATALAESDQIDDLVRALEILHRLGAGPAADALAARLRAAGMKRLPRRPRRATAQNAGGLTARESEVLELLRDGLSDTDIARRLHISPKTTGHHVSAILAKLGVRNRHEAAAAIDG